MLIEHSSTRKAEEIVNQNSHPFSGRSIRQERLSDFFPSYYLPSHLTGKRH